MKIGKVFKLLGATFLLTTVMAVGVSAAASTTYKVDTTANPFKAVLYYETPDDRYGYGGGGGNGDSLGYASGSLGAHIGFDWDDNGGLGVPKYYSTDGKTWIPLNNSGIDVTNLASATKFYFSNDPSANLAKALPEGHIFIPAKPVAPKAKDIFGSSVVDVDNNEITLHAKTPLTTKAAANVTIRNNNGDVIAESGEKYNYSLWQVRVGYGEWYDLEGYVSTYNPIKGITVQIQEKPTKEKPTSKIATYTIPGLAKAPAATYDAKTASITKMSMPAKNSSDVLMKEYALIYRSTTDKALTALTADELKLLKPFWIETSAASVTITTGALVNISSGSSVAGVSGAAVSSTIQKKALSSDVQLVLAVRFAEIPGTSSVTTKAASQVKLFTGVAATEEKQLVRGVDFNIDVNKGILYGTAEKGIDYSFDNKTWKTLPKYVAGTKSTYADLISTAKKPLVDSKNVKVYVRASAVVNSSNAKLVDKPSTLHTGPVGYLELFKDYAKTLKSTADGVILLGTTESINLAALKNLDVEVTSSAATEANPVWVKVGDPAKNYLVSESAVWAVAASDTATVTYKVRVAGNLSNAAVSTATTYEAITIAAPVKTIAVAKRPALSSFPSASTAKIDYANEKLVGFTGFEVTTKASAQVKSDFVSAVDYVLTNAISQGATSVKLRKAGVDGTKPTIASAIKEFTIPTRPDAPSSVTINTTGGATTVTLSSAPTAELKLQVTKDNWTTITELTFAKDAKTATWGSGPATTDTAKVRLKATDKAFYSKDATVTVTAN